MDDKDKIVVYAGKNIDDMTREELIKTINEMGNIIKEERGELSRRTDFLLSI